MIRRVRPSTLVCTAAISGVFVYLFLTPSNVYHYPIEILGPWSQENDTWLPEPGQSCVLPRLDPFHESVLPYIYASVPIKCATRLAWLTYVDEDGILRYNDSALREAGYAGQEDSSLRCDYSGIYRMPDTDDEVKLAPAKRMTGCNNRLDTDFVRVRCFSFLGFTIYENYHVNVKPVDDANKVHRREIKSSEDVTRSVNPNPTNVIVLGLDSMSRSNFVRQLPLTRKYLMSELGAVELRGYTKVGDNTYPNLVPMLTGLPHDSSELPSTVQSEDEGAELERYNVSSQFYDRWPCIWKEFQNRGYATQFAEDQPHLAIFNYARKGFRKSPTDHYMRPFWLAAHDSRLHALSSYLCLGPTPKHDLTLEYVQRFAATYGARGIPFFAFVFLTELSHDFLNQAGAADQPLLEWLRKWRRLGLLNNTVLIVMSDHGHRFDSIRLTAVGRKEEHMPFCAVSLPMSYKATNPTTYSNLVGNAFRLTTPYDIHSTLLHIVRNDLSWSNDDHTSSKYGRSVLTHISGKRTCDAAGVPPEYCMCQREENLPLSDHRTLCAAKLVVAKLNNLTAPYRTLCAALSLKSVHNAQHIKYNSSDGFSNLKLFTKRESAAKVPYVVRVTVETEPGHGFFEGLVKMYGFRTNSSQSVVMKEISRINTYRRQSKCLSAKILKKYNDLRKFCYCVS